MKKKMMALALALVMTGSLAACGGGGGSFLQHKEAGRRPHAFVFALDDVCRLSESFFLYSAARQECGLR